MCRATVIKLPKDGTVELKQIAPLRGWVSGIPMEGNIIIDTEKSEEFEQLIASIKGIKAWSYPADYLWGKPCEGKRQYTLFCISEHCGHLVSLLSEFGELNRWGHA